MTTREVTEKVSITVVIIVTNHQCRSVYPEIVAENEPGRHREAINNVKGGCLIALGQKTNVPDSVTFDVRGICHHCEERVGSDFNSCSSCVDERGP